MIAMDVLYGVGGLVALLLFAYLVVALIRAEAF
ncbi:K(+)-transporting ATPase subunit F (plasmid) [Comamonadaceae bacterium OTU4NAUVB1]|jgi:K+-transporting ATPase KdpF subunit|nr:K(+)-transporting ATPase subunit F [Comamonadaceae bacterium OTU4NAUVB1]HSU23992.1 K(+)-transporting ATPase subunit F [Variovorax sp.]